MGGRTVESVAGREQVLRVRITHPRRENVADTDRQWLMVTGAIFALTLGLCFVVHRIYIATAPHPEITLFLRGAKRAAHWLIPGL